MTHFELTDARPQGPLAHSPFHHWAVRNGPTFAEFYRLGDGYLLRFPDNADFTVTADLAVACIPVPGIPTVSCEHLFLNQVLPLILARHGHTVLHASAVVAGGQALAFIAETGRGKSTLAAAFARDGDAFLTDDGLQLVETAGNYSAIASHPSIRLWDDSHRALLTADATIAPPVHYTSKARFIAGGELRHCAHAVPLGRLYVLGAGEAKDVDIRPIPPSEAVAQMLQHSFILDIEDRVHIAAHFDRLARLASTVGAFHLDYPRRYEALPHVMQAIRAHAADRRQPA